MANRYKFDIGSIDCVITRYNEHINWVLGMPKWINRFMIYNKGPNDNIFKDVVIPDELAAKIFIMKSENIGRIDHTIAYHIINNWDDLPDNLIFLPGTAVMCPRKGQYLEMIRRNMFRLNSKFGGFYGPRRFKPNPDFNFTRDNYIASGICNRNGNNFIRSEYQDFKAWKKELIDDDPLELIAYRGMFCVNKDNIKFNDISVFEKILESVSVGDNIENGHFAERIWAHLFTKINRITLSAE